MRSTHSLLVVLALVAGCGAQQQQETQAPPVSSPAPTNGLTGEWPEKAGQAEEVQRALSGDGYECTKHASDRLDLRMCMKSLPDKADGKPGAVARLRFMADGKGTVVRASVNASSEADGRKMRTEVLRTLLSDEDVAVVEAGGGKITWGSATKNDRGLHLLVKGGEAARQAVSSTIVGMTKEQVLPKLQGAGLKCTLNDQDTTLKCLDPDFEAEGDTSTLGVNNEATLADGGQGIQTITLRGSNSKTPQNVAAVKHLVPPVLGVSDDLADVKKWVESHLDGRAHSAYIGHWGVSIDVGISPMFGDSVSVSVGPEKDDLGAKAAN